MSYQVIDAQTQAKAQSIYLGSVVRPEGFNGHFATIYLCEMPDGSILAVHRNGWHPWEYCPSVGTIIAHP